MMIKIGLTGGIASGKTSIAKWFKDQGLPVFDADQAVHQIMSESTMIEAIGIEFGQEYIKEGQINRIQLGNAVFQDSKLKNRLENLLHPRVGQEMEKIINQAESQGEKIILLDIPLLFEVGWDKSVDEVWVVYVPPLIQIERLIIRNGWTPEEAQRRISSQMSLEEKAKRADRVIDNGGTWEQTEKKLVRIWEEIMRY